MAERISFIRFEKTGLITTVLIAKPQLTVYRGAIELVYWIIVFC